MRRREFVSLLGGAMVAWPFAVRAQQKAMPVIGYVGTASPGLSAPYLAAFHQGLSETGFNQAFRRSTIVSLKRFCCQNIRVSDIPAFNQT
jgi:hypothetical protein